MEVTLQDILKAQKVLSSFVPKTPLLRNPWLSSEYDCDLYLKLETMTAVGSFKLRGATYKISRLSETEKKRGVIAASAGNHAQGVAWGAKRFGVDALIVMPETAPLTKIENTEALGAKIRLEGQSYDEAFEAALRIQKETNRTLIHAYRDPDIVSGQGCIGLEILEDLPDVDVVVASIGGGGLISGISIAIKEQKPNVLIFGCQADGASPMTQSLQKGTPVALNKVQTFADGIAVKAADPQLFELLKSRVNRGLTANDARIALAVLKLMEKGKILAEGAAALPLAALESVRSEIKGKKVCLVISGGNIDVNILSRIIDRGLIEDGRRLKISVLITDKPGSLAKLTQYVAGKGANILQTVHDRSSPSTAINETAVDLIIETKGPDHSKDVVEGLKNIVIRIDRVLPNL